MKVILLTSSALLLVSGLSAAQAQDAEACPPEIDAFTRDYEEAMAAFGSNEALSASEQAELFGLRTTAENQYRAGNAEMCLEAIERARLMLETAIAPMAIDPRELVGMEVRNAEDEHLGEIDGVTLDPMSGRIAYVLVEHGGFLGIGDSLYPVPWRAVTWAPGAESVLLDLTEERLENAPRYLDEEVTPQERRGWLLAVHSYYGVEPYWQDNFPSMAMTQQTAAAPAATANDGKAGAGAGAAAPSVSGASAGNAEPGTEALAADTNAEGQASGDGGETAVTVIEPQPAQGDAAAETSGSDASPSEQPKTSGPGAAIAAGAGEDDDGGVTAAVMSRIDALESRIEELSQQGAGEDVRQAIGDLQARIEEMAQQGPGEEVSAAISDLQSRVQSLAEEVPGEELQSAMAELEARVQELTETAPGQELHQMMARMEAQIRQLAGSGASDGGAANFAAEGATDTAAAGSGAQAGDESGEPRVIVIRPEDVQIIDPGQAGTGGEAGAPAAGQGSASGAEQATTGTEGASQDAASEASGAAAEAGSAGQTATASSSGDSSTGGSQKGASEQAGSAAPSVLATPEAEPRAEIGETAAIGDGEPAAGQVAATPQAAAAPADPDDEGRSAMGAPAEGIESCKEAITRLEEDLTRADEAGVATVDARNELESAQAMLNRDSQALCRAAIKRANDKLVAQGFEPAEAK